MNNKNHTVTIPYSDYIEMVSALEVSKNQMDIIKSHLVLLRSQCKINIIADFTKLPESVKKEMRPMEEELACFFNYNTDTK